MSRRAVAIALVLAAAGCNAKSDGKPDTKITPAGEPVDVCSFVSVADVEAAVGAKVAGPPEPSRPMGSLLGGCAWRLEDNAIATVHARPAGELEGTVGASGASTPVAGLGEKAMSTENAGVMVALPGKSYFLAAHVMSTKGPDRAASEKLARAVVPGAK